MARARRAVRVARELRAAQVVRVVPQRVLAARVVRVAPQRVLAAGYGHA